MGNIDAGHVCKLIQWMQVASDDPKVKHRNAKFLALRLGIANISSFSLMSVGDALRQG